MGCQEEHAINPAACFKAASDFIKCSIVWSLVGAKAEYLGPETHMEYLLTAEECATHFLAFVRDGDSDTTVGGKDERHSFRTLLADLYTSMGAVEQSRNSTAKATSFAMRALELDPEYESARTILSELSKNSGGGRTPDEHEHELLEHPGSSGE